MTPRWRAMHQAELVAVKRLSDQVHATLPERLEILADKFDLFPQGALVLEQDRRPLGYAFAHPWRLGAIPALDALLGSSPQHADCLYLHDVAIVPEGRGYGAARTLVDLLIEIAGRLDLKALALTSVYETHDFWGACGFMEQAAPGMAAKLATYGGPARYMVRPL